MTHPDSIPPHFAAAWRERAAAGEAVVQKCTTCNEIQMHPRRRCTACGSDKLGVEGVSGEATLYTFSVILRNAPSDFQDQLPYTLGIVQLREGPRMLTRIVDCEPERLRCDMPMRWILADVGGRSMPCFRPA